MGIEQEQDNVTPLTYREALITRSKTMEQLTATSKEVKQAEELLEGAKPGDCTCIEHKKLNCEECKGARQA